MSLRLTDFETMVWIARLGSFTKAAERLHVSQSAVTRRVHELEAQLGVVLFQRASKTAQLTEQGRLCVAYAREFNRLAARMRRDLGRQDRISGTVRIGVGETIALWWLPQFVLRTSRIFPGLKLEVNVDLSEVHVLRFDQGEFDMLLLPGTPPPFGARREIDRIPFAFMASPRLALPERALSPAELSRWPLISLSEKSNNFIALMRWFEAGNARPNRIDACNSLTIVANLASAGLGIAFLPTPIFQDRLESGELRLVSTEPAIPSVPIWVVHREDEGLPLRDLGDLAAKVHAIAARR